MLTWFTYFACMLYLEANCKIAYDPLTKPHQTPIKPQSNPNQTPIKPQSNPNQTPIKPQ